MTGPGPLGEWEIPVEYSVGLYGPRLDLEVLPPLLADYVREVAESVKVPVDFVAACVLGTLSCASVRRYQAQIGRTHDQPLGLYMLPTAAPGERKMVLRTIAQPLRDAERELLKDRNLEVLKQEQEIVVYGERIKNLSHEAARTDDGDERELALDELARLRDEMPDAPVRSRLVIDDATTEVTARLLAEHGGLAILSEEAGSLVAVLAGKYSGKGRPALDVHLKGYDGAEIRVDRVGGEPIVAKEPALAILVTPQPAILQRISETPDFLGRGLVGRCCFVLAESLVGTRKYEDRSVDPNADRNWQEVVHAIACRPVAPAGEVPCIRIEKRALDLWIEFYDEIERDQREGGRLSHLRDWASKHPGRAARIAAHFHLVRRYLDKDPSKSPVSPEDMESACEVAMWLTGHALAAYELLGTDRAQRLARQVLGWIRRNRVEQFSRRDVYTRVSKMRADGVVDGALADLRERGFIRLAQSERSVRKGAGRPKSPSFDVNPHTHLQNLHNLQNPNFADYADSADRVQL